MVLKVMRWRFVLRHFFKGAFESVSTGCLSLMIQGAICLILALFFGPSFGIGFFFFGIPILALIFWFFREFPKIEARCWKPNCFGSSGELRRFDFNRTITNCPRCGVALF